ncbi:MAG: SEC-C domain-containing protein [Chloroflexi bacterium]|nr:SEC-C domain-containing protein [Chloroflexota bacterium]
MRTQLRATNEKYRHKAPKVIAFGVEAKDSSQPFDCAFWLDGTWQYDAKMEELIANEPPFQPPPGTKLPGRNAPCWCGSGRKFKKCCLPRFEAGRRRLSNPSL